MHLSSKYKDATMIGITQPFSLLNENGCVLPFIAAGSVIMWKHIDDSNETPETCEKYLVFFFSAPQQKGAFDKLQLFIVSLVCHSLIQMFLLNPVLVLFYAGKSNNALKRERERESGIITNVETVIMPQRTVSIKPEWMDDDDIDSVPMSLFSFFFALIAQFTEDLTLIGLHITVSLFYVERPSQVKFSLWFASQNALQ